LAALDPATLRVVRRADVAAGRGDVELVFEAGAAPRARRLRAHAPDGAPLPELAVRLECAAFRVPATGAALWCERAQRPLGWTDAHGGLTFDAPDGSELRLRVEGAAVRARTLALSELPADGALELERVGFVRVHLRDD